MDLSEAEGIEVAGGMAAASNWRKRMVMYNG
jgi:hypothetical protein